MNLDELTLGQVKELKNLFGNSDSCEKLEASLADATGSLKIVVLQRGWVLVGDYHRVNTECWLTNAHVIRRWGTSEGLGELAKSGPLTETKLEPSGTARFHRSAEVLILDCDASKWKSICKEK